MNSGGYVMHEIASTKEHEHKHYQATWVQHDLHHTLIMTCWQHVTTE
jgi:hypothetical protein